LTRSRFIALLKDIADLEKVLVRYVSAGTAKRTDPVKENENEEELFGRLAVWSKTCKNAASVFFWGNAFDIRVVFLNRLPASFSLTAPFGSRNMYNDHVLIHEAVVLENKTF